MNSSFGSSFPCIRGIQARREYYVVMCPLRFLPKMFQYDEEELKPELRAQRILNKSRLPELRNYILENPDSYVFSALTASVDGDLKFDPQGAEGPGFSLGTLHIDFNARFIINDGQHRRAAIELALQENPDIANETISVVLYMDKGLERCQQMFADLNRHAIRPSASLGLLYEHRDSRAQLTKSMVLSSPIFRDFVEMEKSSLAQRSRKLFTLSAVHTATGALLRDVEADDDNALCDLAQGYWEAVAEQMLEWNLVRDSKLTAGEVRRDFIHSHGIALHALGKAGNTLLSAGITDFEKSLADLGTIDWSRANAPTWEGRALIGGRVSKSTHNVILTANLIKQRLGIALTSEEQRVEDAFQRGDNK
ncbi:MAG: DNA sulfur modification protein DndB [Candidatus Latescibacteria bacterium]|nr:DNA sulfur modification protein DndB [Candidatus Latescibacterota bacterium]